MASRLRRVLAGRTSEWRASEDGDVRGAEKWEERAEVQGDGRLATTAAYEVGAEPRPSQSPDKRIRAAASLTGSRRSLAKVGSLSCSGVPGAGLAGRLDLGLVAITAQSSRHKKHAPRAHLDWDGDDGERKGERRAHESGVNNRQGELASGKRRLKKIKRADGGNAHYDSAGAQAIGTA
jgi:hypothetical protein